MQSRKCLRTAKFHLKKVTRQAVHELERKIILNVLEPTDGTVNVPPLL